VEVEAGIAVMRACGDQRMGAQPAYSQLHGNYAEAPSAPLAPVPLAANSAKR
jgi:hypothetical protein